MVNMLISFIRFIPLVTWCCLFFWNSSSVVSEVFWLKAAVSEPRKALFVLVDVIYFSDDTFPHLLGGGYLSPAYWLNIFLCDFFWIIAHAVTYGCTPCVFISDFTVSTVDKACKLWRRWQCRWWPPRWQDFNLSRSACCLQACVNRLDATLMV